MAHDFTINERSKKSDKRYLKIARWLTESKQDQDDDSLPDITTFNDFEYAWFVFVKMEGTDWRFLPDGPNLLDQDEALWSDLAKLSMLKSKLTKILKLDAVKPKSKQDEST